MIVHSFQSFQIMAFVTATFWSPSPLICKRSRTTAITVYYPLLLNLCVSVLYLQHWLDHAIAQHMTAIANTIALLHCSGQCCGLGAISHQHRQGKAWLSATQAMLQPPTAKTLPLMPNTTSKKK